MPNEAQALLNLRTLQKQFEKSRSQSPVHRDTQAHARYDMAILIVKQGDYFVGLVLSKGTMSSRYEYRLTNRTADYVRGT